ncbi:MAG TPA: hypothetical protein VJT31_20905 [Rugosimonospora sp.]|nr:hypothetical protein [Rugosimonospora sp.]
MTDYEVYREPDVTVHRYDDRPELWGDRRYAPGQVALVIGDEYNSVVPVLVGTYPELTRWARQLVAALRQQGGRPLPRARYRYAAHTTRDGARCVWSHRPVLAGDPTADRAWNECPDGCPSSHFEANPYADDPRYEPTLPDPAVEDEPPVVIDAAVLRVGQVYPPVG